MSGRFIAIDWGTTNRRAFLIEDGVVIATERDDRGATSIAPGGFPDEVAAIRRRHGDHPVLMAGMVGSNVGWRAVPYVPVPAGLGALAAALDWIDDRTAIVPGLSDVHDDHADVMRGEEVQLLGAVASAMVPPTALLAQPGTHCKWAEVKEGRITGFTTAMTGELFALIRANGLLARQLGGEVTNSAAFRAGVIEGAARDLPASLFRIRARGVLGLADDRDAASHASGLLIGADVAARIGAGRTVHVLADPVLGGLYVTAIETLGGAGRLVDSHAAFVAGIAGLWSLCR